MKKHLLTLAAAAVMTISLAPKASAQTLNMDMSWAIRAQNQYQIRGDAFARSMAQSYLHYMQMLRARGYTGPSLAIPFNAQTLQEANLQLQQSFARYNAGWAVNSNRTSNAAGDWSNRAIRGCQVVQDYYGNRYNYCW